MEAPSRTPSLSSFQSIVPQVEPSSEEGFASAAELRQFIDEPVEAGSLSAAELQRVIKESLRHAFDDTVVKYFEGMLKDLKDNQQALHRKIDCVMSKMHASHKHANQSDILPSWCSSSPSPVESPCVYTDGWRRPNRGRSTLRMRESLLRAQTFRAQQLRDEPAKSSQWGNDAKQICWPIAGHPCPGSNAKLNPHISEQRKMESKKHSKDNLDITCEGDEIPGCVNNSHGSVPSNAFDSEIERETCEVQMSQFAEGPEIASSSGVQQEVKTNEESASDQPSCFLAVSARNGSSISSGRNYAIRSLACYRRQAAAQMVSSVPSPFERSEELEPQANSVGMLSNKLILRVVWTAFGILPWSLQSCAVVYRYVVISLAVCLSMLSACSYIFQPDRWQENLITCVIALFTTIMLAVVGKVSDMLGPATYLLEKHSQNRGFTREWERDGVLGVYLSAAICIVVTVINLLIGLLLEPERLPWLGLASYKVVMFTMITQCLCHVISFLDLLVNSFVDQFLHSRDLTGAVKLWNSAQALLHHVSEVMARCLIVMQIFVTLILLTCLVHMVLVLRAIRQATFSQVLLAAPRVDHIHGIAASFMNLLIVLALSVRLFIKAASITESCKRIPSLMNSFHLDTEKNIDHDRQYLVKYIQNSDAGFYLSGTQLTASLMIKAAYFLGALSCTAGTTAISG